MNEKKSLEPFNEESFEKDIYDSLKYYGFLFPETLEDVKHFEKLFGDTEIEAPSSDEILNKSNLSLIFDSNFDINLSMAAYKSEEDSIIDSDEERFKKDDSSDE